MKSPGPPGPRTPPPEPNNQTTKHHKEMTTTTKPTTTSPTTQYAIAQTDAIIAGSRVALRAARDLYFSADDLYDTARNRYEASGRDDDHRALVAASTELTRATLGMRLCEALLDEAEKNNYRLRAVGMMEAALELDRAATDEGEKEQANRALVIALAQHTRAVKEFDIAAARVAAARVAVQPAINA